jgi:hypothetical protein
MQAFERDLFRMMCDLLFPLEDLTAQAARVIALGEEYVLGNAISALRNGVRSFPDAYKDFAGKTAGAMYDAIREKRTHVTLDLAEVLQWSGQKKKAASLLESVIPKESNRYQKGRALRLLIGLRIDEGGTGEARALLDTFRETAPQDPNTLRQVGRLLAERFRDFAGAAAVLKEAYQRQVPSQKFYIGFDYARALRRAGKAEEARRIARQCMKDIGGAMGARYMAAFFQGGGEVLEGYETFLEELLDKMKDPREQVELHMLRADAFLHRKKPEAKKALEALENAEAAADDAGFSRYERERIWAQKCLVANNYLNDRKMQEKYNNLLLSLRPRHENYRLWRAIALARFGESKEAAWEAFRKIPPRRNLAYNRACFFSNMGESEKAIALLRSAIEAIEDVEGRNRQRLWAAADDEFKSLRDLDAFKAVVKLEKD